MKNKLFLIVFFLISSISFARTAEDQVYLVSVQENGTTFKIKLETLMSSESNEDICSVSCYAEIYYNGELRTNLFSSATASDCVTATTDCLVKAKKKADTYIAEAS